MARDMLFCLFFFWLSHSVVLWWEQVEGKHYVLFIYRTKKTGNYISPFIVFCLFLHLSSQTQLLKRRDKNHASITPDSNFLALHRLFLLQAFFLKQKWICRQSIKCSWTKGGFLSSWDSSEQKGSAAPLWFSSLTCFLTIYRNHKF